MKLRRFRPSSQSRSILRKALLLAFAFTLGSAWPAFGQLIGSSGQLAIRSDGFVFWIENGTRHVIYPAQISDEQINGYPEGVPFSALLGPSAGAAPTFPTSSPLGGARATRIPLGRACDCYQIRATGQRSDLQITVTNVERDAWSRLKGTNPSNQLPRDGFEYVLATINVKYVKGPSDLPVSVDRFDYTMLDSNDSQYTPAFVMEPQTLSSQTVFPGFEVTGSVAFQIPRGDRDPVLVWLTSGDNPRWFAVSK